MGFAFAATPRAPEPAAASDECGLWTTSSPAIKNAPLPVDGPGCRSFDNRVLAALVVGVPYVVQRQIGGGLAGYVALVVLLALPVMVAYWLSVSMLAPPLSVRVRLPGRCIEDYLEFRRSEDAVRYAGRRKIPIGTFYEMYFAGDVVPRGDMLDVLERRHDWASFRLTWSFFRYFIFGMVPEVIMHSRSQDEEQVRDHYDRGDDFYGWFLGPRMIYTSGVISDITRAETLEELQDNKLRVVCEKIAIREGESMLDIGCGWGTLADYASTRYRAHVTGITLGRNQTAWGNRVLAEHGVPESQSRILCMDYRDIPQRQGGYKKITCLEMAEHVGVRHFSAFLRQVYDLLDDDGVFFLQIAGLRKSWQFEDLIWGLFMNEYIFPGADASTPLGWFVDRLEGAGFEVKNVDTIGVHYSATLYAWYRNWHANREKVEEKYGSRWFRIWDYFLASSVVASRQGSATCYQITLHKNLNSFHRVLGIPTQYGLQTCSSGKS